MTRTMIDGINTDAAAIAAQASGYQLIAGYVDGLYAWSDAQWSLFPAGIIRVRIAVFSTTNDGVILDVEPGNATPAQSVDWVLLRRAAGVDPTVYMNTSTWPTVRAAFQARGVPEPHYWVAQYDGVPTIPAGAVGKQYADNTVLGQPWDVSVVADFWPGVDPAPIPAPAPVAPSVRRNDMHIDLKVGQPVVFTNPAAVLGGTSYLMLGSDFGDATVRVAVLSFTADSWSTTTYTVARTGGAVKIPLPPDSNKASVTLLSVTPQAGAPFPTTVGLDVLA